MLIKRLLVTGRQYVLYARMNECALKERCRVKVRVVMTTDNGYNNDEGNRSNKKR